MTNLSDFEVVCDHQAVMRSASEFLASLQGRGGITDGCVADVFAPTWEHYYPAMPERLLAIEAVERWGSYIQSDTAARPAHLEGWPYRLESTYTVWWGGEEANREYFATAEDADAYAADLVAQGEEVSPTHVHHAWVIEDPTGRVSMRLLVRPVRAIQHISLTAVLTPKGAAFADILRSTP